MAAEALPKSLGREGGANPPRNVCLLRLSALGDVTHVVPVVRTLQSFWPNTHLTWVIGRLEHQLVGDIPGVEFIVVDKGRGWRMYKDLRHKLQGRRFDVLLQMQVSLRASLLGLMVPADLRIGFDRERARDFQWLFTRHRITHQPRQHVLDSFFGFLEAMGIEERELRWDLPIPEEARAWAADNLPAGRLLAISPCSSNRFRNFRNWPAERYAAVADHAADRHGMIPVLTGGPTPLERDYGEAIIRLCRHPVVNLIGKTSLKQLLAVLDRAEVLLAPDSGPTHMANAVNTPVLGLYASSNPERTGPYQHRNWVINQYPEACRRFLGRAVHEVRWGQRVRAPEVMELITEEAVCARLDECLSSGGTEP